jgi:FMN-dependent NADH-azoreductase
MKKILYIRCSPRGRDSESHRLATRIVQHLQQLAPDADIVERFLGDGVIGHIDADYATALGSTEQVEIERTPRGSMVRSEELVQELERADFAVIGTPMHNFTVPAGLKVWIDHVARVRRTFDMSGDGKIARLADRPVFVAVSSGARYSGERARQPDFLTPYLTFVLGMIGLQNVTFFSIEGTSSNPARLAEARKRTGLELCAHFAMMVREHAAAL